METQKDKALKRLTALESEAKQLRKIIEFPESDKPIMERVKSWEDVCAVLDIPDHCASIGMPEKSALSKDIKSINAYMKLILITRALNEGWEPDWTDSNQIKYFPWFTDYKPGFGFSDASYGDWDTITLVVSRLCLKSRELAAYAAKQFLPIYNDFLTI